MGAGGVVKGFLDALRAALVATGVVASLDVVIRNKQFDSVELVYSWVLGFSIWAFLNFVSRRRSREGRGG